jgi:hypothetical protein
MKNFFTKILALPGISVEDSLEIDKTVNQIITQGADYIIALKKNQGGLYTSTKFKYYKKC